MADIRRVEGKAEQLKDNPTVARLASAGHVVNGIVHLLIGGIAVGVAAGAGGSADNSGAMQALRSTPLGAVTLWVAAVALFALAINCVLAAVTQARSDAKEAVKEAGKGIGHAAVGVVALNLCAGRILRLGREQPGAQRHAAGSTWGAVLLFVVGAAVLAVGIGLIVGRHQAELHGRGGSAGSRATRGRRASAPSATSPRASPSASSGCCSSWPVLRRNPDEAGGIEPRR